MASFGVGVGDIIAVTTLCFKVYRACASASGEFSQIKTEVENLQIALVAVEEEFPTQAWINSHIDRSQRLELQKLLESCNSLLTDVTEQLHPHTKLGTTSQSKWDALKFSKFDLKGTRSRLTAHANSINVFLSTLNAGRLRRMESKLEQVLAEAREGQRDLSAILREDDYRSQLADHQWKILEDELVESGFSRSDIASHRYWFESRAHESSITASEVSGNSSNASFTTATETNLTGEAVLNLSSGRMYTVRHDCTAHNDDSILVPRGDVIECMSNFAVNVLKLDPEFVCGFKHIRSSKIVMLRVSDIQEHSIPFEEGPYLAPLPVSASKTRLSWYSPSPQISVLDVPAFKSPTQTPGRTQQNKTRTVKDFFNGRSTRPSTPQSQAMNIRALPSESQHSHTLPKERLRRLSTTGSIASRASSQARSIKTEASEYDSDGRLVKSKTVTMTFDPGLFPRRSSAPPERNKPDRSILQRHNRTSSSPADEAKPEVIQEVSDLLRHGRKNPSVSSSIANYQSPVQSPRKQQKQQSTPDSRSRHKYPPSSLKQFPSPPVPPVPPVPQLKEDSTLLSRLSRSALIDLYENRTLQLQSVMELLRNHKVITADPFDYSVENKNSVFKEMDMLDLEIAASMTRRPVTGKQKVVAFLTRKKSKVDMVYIGQALAAHDRNLGKGKNRA